MPLNGFDLVTSADSGAPSLTGQNGSMNNVLNYILVTRGGWTRTHHDSTTNQSVFRMPAGSQRSIWVAHDSTISGGAQVATVRGCDSATSFDYASLIAPFPTVAQVTNGLSNWMASSSADSTVRAWRATVWESGVVFAVQAGTTAGYGWTVQWFQDPHVNNPTDTTATIIGNRRSNNNTNFGVVETAYDGNANTDGFNVNSNAKNYFYSSIDGSVSSSCARPINGSSFGIGQYTNAPGITSGYLGRIVHTPVSVSCFGTATVNAGAVAGSCQFSRCFIIGIRNPIHSNASGVTSDDFFTDSAYSPGSVLRPLFVSTNGSGVLMEETNTWEPH